MPTDPDIWLLILYGFLHDISIAVYVGGAVAMEFVLGPAQAAIPPAQAQIMGQKTADRFLWLVWGSLTLIVVTGFLRLEKMGMAMWEWPFFQTPGGLSESYGRTLLTMILLWCVLVVNGALITWYFRPRLQGKLSSRTSASQVNSAQSAKMDAAIWVQRLTRADLVIAVVIALLGASLKWGDYSDGPANSAQGRAFLDTLLGWLHAMAWAVYVGGALTMEWVLRYAQREMPGPQVGVVCKNAGMRYRWLALGCLLLIGLTGGLMLLRLDDAALLARPGAPVLSLSDSYGRTLLLLSVAWGLLLATVAFMAFVLHPAQRRRSKPEMTKEEVAAERQRVGRAIARMDKALRFELVLSVICVGIGASLHAGGLI